MHIIHIDNVDRLQVSAVELLRSLVLEHGVPVSHQFDLGARIKLAQSFPSISERQRCLQVRLLAAAILVLHHQVKGGKMTIKINTSPRYSKNEKV